MSKSVGETARARTVTFLVMTVLLLSSFAGLIGTLPMEARAETPVPVSAYYFDEGTGQVAGDSFGTNHGRLGTTAGADASDPAWTSGISGKALYFDGVDDRVVIPDDPTLDFTTQLTASVWIRLDADPGNYWPVIEKANTDTDASYMIYITPTNYFRPHIRSGGNLWRYGDVTSVPLAVGVWYHLAYTYESASGTMTAYVNGTARSITWTSQPVPGDTIRVSAADLLVGNSTRGGTFFNGAIDQLRLWGTALSPSEIQNIYESEYSGLVGEWNMNEGTGQVVGDSSPYKYDGTLGTTAGSDSGDPTWVNTGIKGGALDFDGVDDYVDMGSPA
ncbi:MAG: LamG domain-containing protein, partial [Candidatus Thermoplasmatota archaeon]|nr:LamG domain-containing protein [Candidatus Thermoplasmatota archaeon]